MTEEYIGLHQRRGAYEPASGRDRAYRNQRGWTDHAIGEHMILSHRVTDHTKATFDEGLHAHSYYEMIVYLGGEVEYIKGDAVIEPHPYSIVWFLPGQMHTARLLRASRYDRLVFYFSPNFFALDGKTVPMAAFMERWDAGEIAASEQTVEAVDRLLKQLQDAFAMGGECGDLLAKAYVTAFFGVLNTEDVRVATPNLAENAFMAVKQYIDREYAEIENVEDIAAHFFYSREHLSRRFKMCFNVSVSEYLKCRRVLESLSLLPTQSVAEASYAVGFRSQSAYIAAFVNMMGCLPSEYKRRI